jgi:carbon-monoxide dehydrogenase large subunit
VGDGGTVINPQRVDEPIRGGIVQAVGGAMMAHCPYSGDGQLRNGTLADYRTPTAGDMPDISRMSRCARLMHVTGQPITPERLLQALGKVS